MRSGLAVGGALNGAISSTSATPGRSLVVSGPSASAASRIERLRRHRENIRRCARELGVDLQASRSGSGACQADQEELAIVGSAAELHGGARRAASRTHASRAAQEDLSDQNGFGRSAGSTDDVLAGSMRTSTEVARTRLRPSMAADSPSHVPVMSSSSGASGSDARRAGTSAGEPGRHRSEPPSMMDDIFEVHGVLMQHLQPHSEEDLRPATGAAEEEVGQAVLNGSVTEEGHMQELALQRAELERHADVFSMSSFSHGTLSTNEMQAVSQALFADLRSPVSAQFTAKSDEHAAVSVARPSSDIDVLHVAEARASPDISVSSHQSPMASPAGASHWADTSASAEESRCHDEQVDELLASGSESRSLREPLAPSSVVAAEPTPTDFSFGGILERWRQQYSDFQHAVSHASVTPAGQVKVPAGANSDMVRSSPAFVETAADDDPEVVLQRIKRELGLEASPLAHEVGTVGNTDFGLLLSDTSSAHSDSILERLNHDIHELDHMKETPLALQEGCSSSETDAGSVEHLSKFHLGLLNGFENFTRDGLDKFSEQLRIGPFTTCEDAQAKGENPSSSSEAVLARLQSLEAELVELRKSHVTTGELNFVSPTGLPQQATMDQSALVNTETPSPSPRRPAVEQSAPNGEAVEQLRNSMASLLSSTASSIFGLRSDMPAATPLAAGLDSHPESSELASASAPQVGVESAPVELSPAAISPQPVALPQPAEEPPEIEFVDPHPATVLTAALKADTGSGPGDVSVVASSSQCPPGMTPEKENQSLAQQLAAIATSDDVNAYPPTSASVNSWQSPARVGSPRLVPERRPSASQEELDELPTSPVVARTPPAAARCADVAVGVSDLGDSPQFGVGISMMDKLFSEAKLDSNAIQSAMQTASTQTSPVRETPEPMDRVKRPPMPALASARSPQAWDGSGDAYFQADRRRPGLAASDCFPGNGYRPPAAAPHAFPPLPHHLGILAGSDGGVRPSMRYPVPHGSLPTPPMSPSTAHAGPWLHGPPSHPGQVNSPRDLSMFGLPAGLPAALPNHPERRQTPPAMFSEGVATGNRADDQLLIRTYEVYRQQQLELLRPT